jgi:2-keto-4-pentenoate hydratase/2-oxohepta-3-ene-1,7-dioic acid hydratase in catechol pathway
MRRALGTTIPAGTSIMTGSPPGIGYFQKPKYSLCDGDVVEAEISNIGTLRNVMVFEGKVRESK